MVLRVYALYGRESIVLWVLGIYLILSISVGVMLVRRLFVIRTDSCLFNALYQRWVGSLQDEMVSENPPPVPCCVPYRSFKQCAFHRTLLKYRCFIDNCLFAIRVAEDKVRYFVLSSYLETNLSCCRK